jgi:hypothetical protein
VRVQSAVKLDPNAPNVPATSIGPNALKPLPKGAPPKPGTPQKPGTPPKTTPPKR